MWPIQQYPIFQSLQTAEQMAALLRLLVPAVLVCLTLKKTSSGVNCDSLKSPRNA